ncbi:MAG: glutathione S-transferase N-terminal domain-containing protein [Cardiobacteriaceae bacterium]|nr:glutathione S-transferase N-terminal domain-containing protein [Cardiobacteriaceae bacterium]
MKLYYLPAACSLTCHIALEWTKSSYEIENIRAKLKSEEYEKINPMMNVPCLVDDDFVLTQNVAILKYLDDKFPAANLFASSDIKGKAKVMKWLAFCNSDLHTAFVPLFAPQKFVTSENALQELKNNASTRIKNLLNTVNNQMQDRDFLADKKSVADAYLFVILGWCKALQLDISEYSNLTAFVAIMAEDEGVKAALSQEGL